MDGGIPPSHSSSGTTIPAAVLLPQTNYAWALKKKKKKESYRSACLTTKKRHYFRAVSRQQHNLTCSFACLIKFWTRSRWGRLMRAPIRVSSRSGSPILIFWVRFTTSFVKVSRIFLSTNTRVPLQHTWNTERAADNKARRTLQAFLQGPCCRGSLKSPQKSC